MRASPEEKRAGALLVIAAAMLCASVAIALLGSGNQSPNTRSVSIASPPMIGASPPMIDPDVIQPDRNLMIAEMDGCYAGPVRTIAQLQGDGSAIVYHRDAAEDGSPWFKSIVPSHEFAGVLQLMRAGPRQGPSSFAIESSYVMMWWEDSDLIARHVNIDTVERHRLIVRPMQRIRSQLADVECVEIDEAGQKLVMQIEGFRRSIGL